MNNEWISRAACTDIDAELFFPPADRDVFAIRAAKDICRVCPVRDSCLDHAVRHEPYGIWGGATEAERTWVRRTRGIELVPVHYSLFPEVVTA